MYSENLSELTFESLEGYFRHLSMTGYMKQSNVNGLLLLILIDDFLYTEMNAFVSEEDYNVMSKVLSCLFNRNCLIPWPEFLDHLPQIGSILPGIDRLRISEDKILRSTEDENLRVTES